LGIAALAASFTPSALADAEHAKPPSPMTCPGVAQLAALSQFGTFDASYVDRNGNGYVCAVLHPAQSNSTLTGTIHDDVGNGTR
jgi:hypothetical protein